MVVLPLSTTDAGCGTLHFTLTVIINSSSNSSQYDEVNRHASVLDKSKKFAAGTFRDDITTINSSNNCKKQPAPVQSLSTSVNIATQLPDSLTNQDNANSKLRSFNFTDPEVASTVKQNSSTCLSASTHTTSLYSPRRSNAHLESNSDRLSSTGGKLQRFRRLSSTELSSDNSHKTTESIQHTRRSLRISTTADSSNLTPKHEWKIYTRDDHQRSHDIRAAASKRKEGSKVKSSPNRIACPKEESRNAQKKISSKLSPLPDVSLVSVSPKSNESFNGPRRKMSEPTVPLKTYKISNNTFSNIKFNSKGGNAKNIQNFDPILRNANIGKPSGRSGNDLPVVSTNFPTKQKVQRVSYILSVSSAASVQPSSRAPSSLQRTIKKSNDCLAAIENRNQPSSVALKRMVVHDKFDDGESSDKIPSPNKRANTDLVPNYSSDSEIYSLENVSSNKKSELRENLDLKIGIGLTSPQNNEVDDQKLEQGCKIGLYGEPDNDLEITY